MSEKWILDDAIRYNVEKMICGMVGCRLIEVDNYTITTIIKTDVGIIEVLDELLLQLIGVMNNDGYSNVFLKIYCFVNNKNSDGDVSDYKILEYLHYSKDQQDQKLNETYSSIDFCFKKFHREIMDFSDVSSKYKEIIQILYPKLSETSKVEHLYYSILQLEFTHSIMNLIAITIGTIENIKLLKRKIAPYSKISSPRDSKERLKPNGKIIFKDRYFYGVNQIKTVEMSHLDSTLHIGECLTDLIWKFEIFLDFSRKLLGYDPMSFLRQFLKEINGIQKILYKVRERLPNYFKKK